MKKKLIILISILVLTVLATTLVFSYAYISASRNYTNVAIVNTKLPNGSYTFNTSNSGTISYTFNSNKMLASASSTTAIASNSAVINVSLKAPDANTVVICTYDLVWEWTSTDQYVASDVTLPYSSYNYEYSIKGSSTTTGNPSTLPSLETTLAETDLSKFAWNSTKGTIGNSAIIVKSASIASMSTTATNTSWTLTSSMYNIPEPQPNLMNQTFTGKIKVANVDCDTNTKLPSTYNQVNYLASSGTQYIDTKQVHKSTLNMEIDFKGTIIEYAASGSMIAGDNRFQIETRGTSNRLIFGIGNYIEYAGPDTFSYLTRNKYKMESNHKAYINNNLVTTLSGTITDSTYTLTLFARRGPAGGVDAYCHWNIYGCKLYDGTNLTRNFVPAIRTSDNVAGLYDVANSGKNLFDAYNLTTISTKSNGYIKTTPSTVYQYYNSSKYPLDYTFKTNTQYTISYNCYYEPDSNSTHKGGGIAIVYTDGTAHDVICSSTTDTHMTYTTTAGKTIQKVAFGYQYNLTTYYKDIQLEEGTVATDYEPFPFYTNSGTGTFTTG